MSSIPPAAFWLWAPFAACYAPLYGLVLFNELTKPKRGPAVILSFPSGKRAA